MASSQVISVTVCFAVVLIQTISTQTLDQRHPAEHMLQLASLGPIPSPHMDTECLCKDLASAIQSVFLAKMTQHSPRCPLYKNMPSYGPIIPNLIPNTGNIVTNSICDGTIQCQCPICSKKWQDALARVLGVKNYGQKCTGSSHIPYGNIATMFGVEGLGSGVQNIYSVQEGANSFDPRSMSLTNLDSLLARSVPTVPSNSKKHPDFLIIGGPNALNAGSV